MYKLAEFRKRLEQNKPSSRDRVGSYSKLRLSVIKNECQSCNATGRHFFGLLRCQYCFDGYVNHIGSYIEERNDDVKPIRDMMERINEMYNKPR
jgi:hypothetical protein